MKIAPLGPALMPHTSSVPLGVTAKVLGALSAVTRVPSAESVNRRARVAPWKGVSARIRLLLAATYINCAFGVAKLAMANACVPAAFITSCLTLPASMYPSWPPFDVKYTRAPPVGANLYGYAP